MLNVHDLERRWLKYKIKQYLPIVLFGLIAIFGAVFLLLQLNNESDTVADTSQKATVVKTPLKIEQNLTKVVKTSEVKNDKPLTIDVPQNTQEDTSNHKTLVLKPSLQFMNNIEDGLNPYYDEELETPQEDSTAYNTQSTNSEEPLQKTEQTTQTEPETQKKNSLIITAKKDKSDLKDVIRRFKKNKNPALSLFIAKRYYEMGEYQKSYNYALMTNEINKDIDESWIIFSKSLVKLGQHELAMLTLKSYLKTKKSSQAEILLKKIESGSFR